MNHYLAVDIGASSGRHILGSIENGKMTVEEIYRFPNGMIEKDGHKYWDTEALFKHILAGMKKCAEIGKIPASMGIDTWAVDYALIGKDGELVSPVYGYRDSRTENIGKEVYERIPLDELYARTGIQKQPFNTIYQLAAALKEEPESLEKAEMMLMIPDYFHYLLTGCAVTEYTNASTTQLLDPGKYDWDLELIERVGIPKHLFTKIAEPGTVLGDLKKEIADEVGFNCKVVLPATHDTGSAVVAVPAGESDDYNVLYISSGTWSLMGTELMKADTSAKSMERNLTNEGGYEHRLRYLKNIMGLWMIQSAKAELVPDMSYGELCEAASKETIRSIIPANDGRFLSPANMTEEVKAACRESGQQIPETPAQVAAVIYNSLAACYAETLREIEEMTGKHYDCIHVIGGGSNADYLNRITAKACERTVFAGPSEATAIGNLLVQMIAGREIKGLKEARKLVFDSFDIREYAI
ncbi:MAG: rhamnulokinase [Lachnospiraceae bacterium]|nr:rhamnulokinase [Lachnospiraceae bacterium]